MYEKNAYFRFYEELNDFLPVSLRKVSFPFPFKGKTTVKDIVESIGVPHTEIDLILVDGVSVAFEHILENDSRVSVYPVFECFDISPVVKLRPKPLRKPKFILDVHLGKLARYMLMFGLDTLYRNDFDDPEIVETALTEKRIILTRDLGILKTGLVTHGYWLRNTDPSRQIVEVLKKFDLLSCIDPFSRCISCNGLIADVSRQEVLDKIPPRTAEYFSEFKSCEKCGKIYWRGSHFLNMEKQIGEILEMLKE